MPVNTAFEPHDQARHQGAGQRVGRQYREDDRFRQRGEEVSCHPGKKEHGNENDADARGRDQGRQGDFARPDQNALLQSFAGAQVAFDILNGHRGVIHQNADRQSQPPQCHQVNRFPDRTQNGQGSQDRKRDGNGDDEGAPPRTKKKQNHQRRQDRRNHSFSHHTADGRLDEDRFINERLHFHIISDRFHHLRQSGFDAGNDLESRSIAAFENAQEGAANSILTHDVRLRIIPVAHLGYVPNTNDRFSHRFDRQFIEARDQNRAGIEIDRILVAAHFGRAAGKHQVLARYGIDHVLFRKVLRFQRFWIQIHRNNPNLAAVGQRNTHTGHADQSHPDGVQGDVVDLLLGESLAADAILQNRHGGGVVLDDQGRRGARGKLFQDRLRDGGELGHARVGRRALLKENLDHPNAIVGGGFDVLNIVHRGG